MIRLGVIGFGKRMCDLVKVFRQIEPDISVVGILDPDKPGARERLDDCDKKNAVFYASLKELVECARPDALAIGTRCNLHTQYAIEASQYDLPLFLEKPVAISMEQATALEKNYANTKCQVLVSFPLRVSPLCVQAKELIDRGALGSCEHITAINYVPYGTVYWEEQYRNYSITQGLFIQKATHDLDYISFLMGSNIIRVAAMATTAKVFGGGGKPAGLVCSQCDEQSQCPESPQNRLRNCSQSEPMLIRDHKCLYSIDCGTLQTGTNEDSSSALLEFASGAHGIYTQVFFSRRDAAARGAIVSGYHGTVSFDWYKNQLKLVRHHSPFTDTVKADANLSHFGGDIELAHDFINLIKGTGRPRSTINDGIQSIYACLAAKESVHKRQFVNVRQVGQTS